VIYLHLQYEELILANKKRSRKHESLAAIEYHGLSGATQECMEAVMRLIQFNDQITKARILTWSNEHCLLLSINVGDLVAIKSGFASGYIGKGSSGFSYVLQLLRAHGAEIEEYEVRRDLIDRLDSSCLTHVDLDRLELAHPVRPPRWHDYIHERDWGIEKEGKLWREFPYIIPLAIIDYRIVDLAKSFWQSPDEKLLIGYRRLEDIVRRRTGLNEHGSKLFSRAFSGSDAKLIWKGLNNAEQAGRAGLFTSAYLAFRNPRAHKEIKYDTQEALTEFLHLNHLYHLEQESSEVEEAE
jgi:hypothetical protein